MMDDAPPPQPSADALSALVARSHTAPLRHVLDQEQKRLQVFVDHVLSILPAKIRAMKVADLLDGCELIADHESLLEVFDWLSLLFNSSHPAAPEEQELADPPAADPSAPPRKRLRPSAAPEADTPVE
eukprot:Polyplicarium_translucidae@DN610_c0_g1_i1.p1